jgi:hypothetical protein
MTRLLKEHFFASSHRYGTARIESWNGYRFARLSGGGGEFPQFLRIQIFTLQGQFGREPVAGASPAEPQDFLSQPFPLSDRQRVEGPHGRAGDASLEHRQDVVLRGYSVLRAGQAESPGT